MRYEIALSRELGMTHREMGERMSSRELLLQIAYDEVCAEEAKHAEAAAEVKQAVRKF